MSARRPPRGSGRLTGAQPVVSASADLGARGLDDALVLGEFGLHEGRELAACDFRLPHRKGADLLLWLTQQVEGQPLGRARADAWKALELIDQTLQPPAANRPERRIARVQAERRQGLDIAARSAAREQLEKASQNAYKSYEEISKLQKDNWDAVVASSQIWAKGAEVVGKAWMTLAQDTLESAATTANTR